MFRQSTFQICRTSVSLRDLLHFLMELTPVGLKCFTMKKTSSINTQLCVDSDPYTGLSFLVECLVPSRPNKISFSISWVNGCSPTGLTVLDNCFLVLVGFVGCPCCFQLFLNPTLSSNYLGRKSLEEAAITTVCLLLEL